MHSHLPIIEESQTLTNQQHRSGVGDHKRVNLHSFIMPMSTQRLSRQAWQWRRLSLVMVQLPLNGQVKEALRFILRLQEFKMIHLLIQNLPVVVKIYFAGTEGFMVSCSMRI